MILVRPKAFPLDRPVGCPRPATKAVPDVASKLHRLGDDGIVLDGLFTDIVGCAEEEWCLLVDEVADDNCTPSPCYCGRAAGPRYKWGEILHNCNGDLGRDDDIGLGFTLLAKYFSELAGIISGVARRGVITPACQTTFAAITLAMRKPRGTLAAAICEGSPKWAWRCAGAGYLAVVDQAAIPKLKEWAAEAKESARVRRKKAAAVIEAKWRQWVDEQLANGAGALHRITKRQSLTVDEAVATAHGPSMKIADVLGSDRAVWAAIWGKFNDSAHAPWRTDFDPNASWVATLPRLTAEDLKAAARKFKRRTQLGCDSVHPRAVGWLSNDLLEAIADFFMVLEKKGIWPRAVGTILMS